MKIFPTPKGLLLTAKLPEQQQAEAKANAPRIVSSGGGVYRVTPDGHITTLHEPSQNPYRYQDGTGVEYQINPDGSIQQLPGAAKPASASSSGDYTLKPGDVRIDANGNVIARGPKKAAPASVTGPTGPPRFDSTNSNSNKYRSDQYGNPLLRNGKIVPLPGYKPAKNNQDVVPTGSSPGSSSRVLTPTESTTFTKSAMQIATNAANGGKDDKGVFHPPISREQALQEMQLAGLFADLRTARIAMKALNKAFPPLGPLGPAGNLFGASGQAVARAATTGP